MIKKLIVIGIILSICIFTSVVSFANDGENLSTEEYHSKLRNAIEVSEPNGEVYNPVKKDLNIIIKFLELIDEPINMTLIKIEDEIVGIESLDKEKLNFPITSLYQEDINLETYKSESALYEFMNIESGSDTVKENQVEEYTDLELKNIDEENPSVEFEAELQEDSLEGEYEDELYLEEIEEGLDIAEIAEDLKPEEIEKDSSDEEIVIEKYTERIYSREEYGKFSDVDILNERFRLKSELLIKEDYLTMIYAEFNVIKNDESQIAIVENEIENLQNEISILNINYNNINLEYEKLFEHVIFTENIVEEQLIGKYHSRNENAEEGNYKLLFTDKNGDVILEQYFKLQYNENVTTEDVESTIVKDINLDN